MTESKPKLELIAALLDSLTPTELVRVGRCFRVTTDWGDAGAYGEFFARVAWDLRETEYDKKGPLTDA